MKQHEHVKSVIERSIIDEKYPIGEPLPRLEELAAEQSCSISTVRRAMRGLIDAGVVESAKKRGTTVLRKPAAGRVVVVLSNDVHSNVLLQEPICTALTDAHMDVDIIAGGVGEVALHNWCRRLLAEGREADVLVSIGYTGTIATRASEQEIFNAYFRRRIFVLFEYNGNLPQDCTKVVVPDWQREARVLAEFLLERGHRRLAIFSGYGEATNGWYGRIADRFCRLVDASGGRSWPCSNPLSNNHLLNLVKEQGVTAYVALNDSSALQIVAAMQQAGLNVPDDFSVVGRNDTPWAERMTPALTSLSVNPEAMAQATVAAVRDFKTLDMARHVYEVTPSIVERYSTKTLQG